MTSTGTDTETQVSTRSFVRKGTPYCHGARGLGGVDLRFNAMVVRPLAEIVV